MERPECGLMLAGAAGAGAGRLRVIVWNMIRPNMPPDARDKQDDGKPADHDAFGAAYQVKPVGGAPCGADAAGYQVFDQFNGMNDRPKKRDIANGQGAAPIGARRRRSIQADANIPVRE